MILCEYYGIGRENLIELSLVDFSLEFYSKKINQKLFKQMSLNHFNQWFLPELFTFLTASFAWKFNLIPDFSV